MDKLEDIVRNVQGNEYFNQLLDLGYTGEQAMEIMQRQAENANAEMHEDRPAIINYLRRRKNDITKEHSYL